MQVILLEKVSKLGNLGDQVNVKAGYARNFLIPFGKAVFATKTAIEQFETRREGLEQAALARKEKAESRAKELADIELSIAVHAGDGGKLFGSIGTRDLADLINSTGIEVAKSEIRLPHGPIRQVGSYQIDLHLHPEVNTHLTLVVVAEENEA